MPREIRQPPLSPISWDSDGTPRSALYDDIYYSKDGGLAETRAVFLEGCGLPDAWAGRERFVVGELGFGTGLNILALLDLWRRTRPTGARLHVFSVEAHLMPAGDARRALSSASALGDLAERLVTRWPRRAAGFHRIDFPDLDASIDLAAMDAVEALEAWEGQADAWFLDGFSPSRNPAMWSDAVIAGVARRSAPGARAATFTVAGEVRRRLQANGFEVIRKPGFGAKRERLEARRPPAPPSMRREREIAIIGAGIAGAALARAFRALGERPTVFEAVRPGSGASGNPAALVMPRIDAGGGAVAALYAQALARAADLYETTAPARIASGGVLLETGPKDAGRFERVAQSELFEPGAVTQLSPEAASGHVGEPVAIGGLAFRDARVVEPDKVLSAWLDGARLVRAWVSAVEAADRRYRLLAEDGREIGRADIVCVAAGMDAARLAPGLPLAPVRGQASLAALPAAQAVIGAGYAIPARKGTLFGATHDRDDSFGEVRMEDHARNLDLVRRSLPALAARLARAGTAGGRAGVRAATPDFLPLAGLLDRPGLFILSGLGSRGFCAAPLLAEHVAALALGAPSPLPARLAGLVHPGRFAVRRERRLGRSTDVRAALKA